MFFNQELTGQSLAVEYDTQLQDKGSEIYGETYKFFGIIKSLTANDVFMLEGSPNESFKMYCDIGTPVKEGDLITDEKGRKYTIRTIRETDYYNINVLRADLNLQR